ncbi:MAG: hypothetical protein ACRD44_16510 [Bryobacteraceae bacterium]
MDLKVYYRKIREIEASLDEPDALLISLETPDGGKPGVGTEVGRLLAARLIVEGRARPATKEERARFDAEKAAAMRSADEMAERGTMRVTLAPEGDVRSTRGTKPGK